MILKYSRKNLISLQILCNFCSMFGIIPLYSFEEKRFLRSKSFMVYMAFLFCLLVGAEGETIYRIYCIESFNLENLVAVVGDILGVLIWSTAMYQACIKKHIWESLFTKIMNLEGLNNLNTTRQIEHNILKNVNLQLACTIVMIIGLFVYERVTFIGEDKKVFFFNTSYIYFFLHFLLSAIIGNVALIVKNKYQEINSLLSTYENDDTVTVVKGTKKVKDLYASMTDVVEIFNEIFGPQLFLMGLHCSSQILQWSISLVRNTSDGMSVSSDQSTVYIRLVIGVIYIFLMLIWLGVTMFCCDIAVVESEEIVTICYRLQLNYSVFSDPYQAIKNLLYLVSNSKIRFTAMDYYEINRSTMFDLIGSTATYFVVLIQFYGKKGSH